MKQVCLDRYQQFWCAGNASKIKQRDINYYAGLYAKGALDPKAAVAACVHVPGHWISNPRAARQQWLQQLLALVQSL
jgi:hypothetical protein